MWEEVSSKRKEHREAFRCRLSESEESATTDDEPRRKSQTLSQVEALVLKLRGTRVLLEEAEARALHAEEKLSDTVERREEELARAEALRASLEAELDEEAADELEKEDARQGRSGTLDWYDAESDARLDRAQSLVRDDDEDTEEDEDSDLAATVGLIEAQSSPMRHRSLFERAMLDRQVAVIEASKIAAVSRLKAELEASKCELAATSIRAAAAQAECRENRASDVARRNLQGESLYIAELQEQCASAARENAELAARLDYESSRASLAAQQNAELEAQLEYERASIHEESDIEARLEYERSRAALAATQKADLEAQLEYERSRASSAAKENAELEAQLVYDRSRASLAVAQKAELEEQLDYERSRATSAAEEGTELEAQLVYDRSRASFSQKQKAELEEQLDFERSQCLEQKTELEELLEDERSHSRQQIADLEAQLDEERSQSRQQIADLEAQLDEERSQSRQQIVELEAQLNVERSRAEAKKTKCADLEKQLEEARRRSEAGSREQSSSSAKEEAVREALEADVEYERSRYEAKDVECADLQKKVARGRQKVTALEADVKTRDARVTILETHLAKLDAHLTALAVGGDTESQLSDYDNEASPPKAVPADEEKTPVVDFGAPPPQLQGDDDPELLRQELELARAALEGAEAAALAANDLVEQRDAVITELTDRLSELELKVADDAADVAAVRAERDANAQKLRDHLEAADARVREARETAAMVAEEIRGIRLQLKGQMERYRRGVDEETAVLSAQLTANAVVAEITAATAGSDNLEQGSSSSSPLATHANHPDDEKDQTTTSLQDASLQDVVAQCTRTIESLKRMLTEEIGKSERLAAEVETAEAARREVSTDIEAARNRAYLAESRADAAEARLEAALDRHQSSNERLDTADVRVRAFETQAATADERAAVAKKALERAETERDAMAHERDVALAAATGHVAAVKEAKDREASDWKAQKEHLQRDLDDMVRAAQAECAAANAAAHAIKGDFQRQRAIDIDERDATIQRARAEVDHYRQLADDCKQAAADAYAESARVRGILKVPAVRPPDETRDLKTEAKEATEALTEADLTTTTMPTMSPTSTDDTATVQDIDAESPKESLTTTASTSTDSIETVQRGTDAAQQPPAATSASIGTSTDATGDIPTPTFSSTQTDAVPTTAATTTTGTTMGASASVVTTGTATTLDETIDMATQSDDQAEAYQMIPDDAEPITVGTLTEASLTTDAGVQFAQPAANVATETDPVAAEVRSVSSQSQTTEAPRRTTGLLVDAESQMDTRAAPILCSTATETATTTVATIGTSTLKGEATIPRSVAMGRLAATMAYFATKVRDSRRSERRLALRVWRVSTERDCWNEAAIEARARVLHSIVRSIAARRRATALAAWRRATIETAETTAGLSSEAPPPPPIQAQRHSRSRMQVADRVAAIAAGVSAAAKMARGDDAFDSYLDSRPPHQNAPVLFRRNVDASGGVVGVDGKELCPAFQFGNCEAQEQTGLVMHHLPDGSITWHWHACVACARVTGRLANHARFSANGRASTCPIAERANDRVFEVLPNEIHKANLKAAMNDALSSNCKAPAANTRLRYQENCMKTYEKHRGELMSALGTALMQLHSAGLSYPTWVWELYERSRVERQALHYITNT